MRLRQKSLCLPIAMAHAGMRGAAGCALPEIVRWRSRQCHSRRSARAAAPPSALTWRQTHKQPLLPDLHKPSAVLMEAP